MTQKAYSFTLTPPDRAHQYSQMKYKNPLKMVYLDDRLIFQHVFKRIKLHNWIIYPELDRKGRLHYHGTLNMNHTQLTRFYKCGKPLLQRIGYVDCSPTANPLDWLLYCRKEWHLTKEVLELEIPISGIIFKLLLDEVEDGVQLYRHTLSREAALKLKAEERAEVNTIGLYFEDILSPECESPIKEI